MAFNQAQTRTVRVVVVSLALAAVIVLAVAVVGGGIFGAQSAATSGGSDAQASSDGSGSDGSSAPTSSSDEDETTMADVDAQYQDATDTLQAQYDADPENPSALLNLANGYFDWGAAARAYVEDDDDDAHVVDLFSQAISRYDDYLEKYGADSGSNKSVQVDRATPATSTPRSQRSRTSWLRPTTSVPPGPTSACSTSPRTAPTTPAQPMRRPSRPTATTPTA